MDSSSVLRNQSQNKIHSGVLRIKNEHNKLLGDSKPFKLQPAPQLSKKDAENQDPEISAMTKALVHHGISRLPVLAKSLRAQTPSDFSESHCSWKEQPLAGKDKKKRPCTRAVPFNLSQPKSSQTARENQQPLTVSQYARQPGNNKCRAGLKTQNVNAKHSKHPAMLSSNVGPQKGTLKSHGKATDSQMHVSGQSGPPHTFRTLPTLSNPLATIPNSMVHQNSIPPSSQPSHSAEACLENTDLVSIKDPAKNSNTTQNPELTSQGSFSKASTGKKFQPDHAALLSILCNKGVSATGQGSATPQSKPYNYVPQRVSVMKSHQKDGHTTGSLKSVQFSPDAAALQSILHNEGVKAAGPTNATPRTSVRPSGRGTSIMTAQRVPVRKNRAETNGGAAAIPVKDTPLKEWTPQRVPTRHQPMSAMKWHLSTQPSPFVGTSSLRRCKTNLEPSQERDVVQRLFNDREDEQRTNVTDKHPDTQADQLPAQTSSTTTHCDENTETSRADIIKDEEGREQSTAGGQPFFQAPQRDSVIFFSTGKKLFRAPRFEKQEGSSNQDGAASPEQRKMLLAPEEMSPLSAELNSQIKLSAQSPHRDTILHKSCAVSPALALLRKRFPPLEELRMDEEVATYTPVTLLTTPGFVPPRPRCGNPVATFLLFEESTTFVPIGLNLSSAPPSPDSSTLQER